LYLLETAQLTQCDITGFFPSGDKLRRDNSVQGADERAYFIGQQQADLLHEKQHGHEFTRQERNLLPWMMAKTSTVSSSHRTKTCKADVHFRTEATLWRHKIGLSE